MGREVKDTYRWMEDIRSPETLNWLKTQDTLRDNYKGEKLKSLTEHLKHYSTIYGKPIFKEGEYFFSFHHNTVPRLHFFYYNKQGFFSHDRFFYLILTVWIIRL
ncbi:MAG: hypothetical protein IPN13_10950 [Bacteroidetes bacterium]|nr:hypothetical protein [Bacteroidota bacterium]